MNDLLEEFAKIFLQWNKVHNISGVKNRHSLEKIIQDCLYPLEFLPKFSSCLDLGSGAGFPGIILAMSKQDAHFHLIEPRQKKYAFLHYAKAHLGLQNVSVRPQKIQDMQSFDVDLVVSKAFSDEEEVMRLCERFLHKKSIVLLYKGKNTASKNHKVFRHENSFYVVIGDL